MKRAGGHRGGRSWCGYEVRCGEANSVTGKGLEVSFPNDRKMSYPETLLKQVTIHDGTPTMPLSLVEGWYRDSRVLGLFK